MIQFPQACLSKECPKRHKCGRFVGNIRRAIVRRSADYHDWFNYHAHCSSYSETLGYKEWDEYYCGPNADYHMFLKGRL